jgi:hypothetical protein
VIRPASPHRSINPAPVLSQLQFQRLSRLGVAYVKTRRENVGTAHPNGLEVELFWIPLDPKLIISFLDFSEHKCSVFDLSFSSTFRQVSARQ